MTSPPDGVEQNYPLARLTTVRTGGAADWFARPADEEGLVAGLRWAEAEGLPVGVIGSGSNLLQSLLISRSGYQPRQRSHHRHGVKRENARARDHR